MAQKKKTPAKAAAKTAPAKRPPVKTPVKAKKTAATPKPQSRKQATTTATKSSKPATKPAAKAPVPKSIAKKADAAKAAAKKSTAPVAAAKAVAAQAMTPAAPKAAAPPKATVATPPVRTILSPKNAAQTHSVKPPVKANGAAVHVPADVPKAIAARPVAPVAPPPAPAPVAAAPPAVDTGPKKPVSQRHGFKTNELIVYPTRGVGRIIGIEEQEIAGMTLELFVIQFEKDKLILRVPTGKLQSVGMRKLAEDGIVKRAMDTLKGKARIKRTMWSRRAQEYEAKINSGDLVSIAEVVRDLYRSEAQPEQSYSERQLYEAALDRMAREIAAVEKLDERGASQRITEILEKSARGRRQSDGAAAVDEAAKAA